MRFDYTGLRSRVLFGRGRVMDLAGEVRKLGSTRALVLSTPGHRAIGERVACQLGELAAGVYANATMHTPVDVTDDALAVLQRLGADCIVAVGGGSTIGLGKALALRTDLPQVAVPTTYAGSEVTTMLGETRDGVKKTQRSPRILPEVVIYDVDLTLTLPATLSATSGFNAMAHAVEALYAKDGNPVVSLMAEAAIRAIAESLPRIVADSADIDARTKAQYGAWLCGMCMGVTMGLHHKACHVLGGAFNLPHAETHTVLLRHVVEYNFDAAPDAMRRIARALGATDARSGLDALARALPVPRSLEALGMPAAGISHAADLVMRESYPNPRPLERAAITRMLTRAFHGTATEA